MLAILEIALLVAVERISQALRNGASEIIAAFEREEPQRLTICELRVSP
jgi:hypothetical protein